MFGPAAEMLLTFVVLFVAAAALFVYFVIRPLWPRISAYWRQCQIRDAAAEAKRETPTPEALREADELVRPLSASAGGIEDSQILRKGKSE